MATVLLRRQEIEEQALPFVCVKCGRPANLWKTKRFLLASSSGAVGMLTQIEVPLCSAHKNHWLWRGLFGWGVGGVLVALFLGLLALAEARVVPPGWRDTLGPVFGISFFGLVIWVPVMIVLHLTSIRPVKVTADTITLKGVAQGFKDALQVLRDERVGVPKAGSRAPIPRGKFQVVGIPAAGGPKRVVATFTNLAKARECADFLQNGGTYLETAVEEVLPATAASKRRLVRGAVAAGAVLGLLALGGGVLHWATTRFRAQERGEIAAPVAANVAVPAANTPARLVVPDFSGVDYAFDSTKVDYSKGPGGQPVFEVHWPYRVGKRIYPQTLQGFVRLQGDLRAVGAGIIGLGACAHGPGSLAVAVLSRASRFIAHGKQTVVYPSDLVPPAKDKAQPQRFLEEYFFDGVLHGPYTEWHTNGQVKVHAAFKHGQKHGHRVTWDENGNKDVEEPYLDGKRHGIMHSWYADGKPRLEGAWVMDNRHGPWKKWDENGTQEVVYWAHGAFDHSVNSRQAFIWALNLTADGRNRNGDLVYQDMRKFHDVFGRPNAVMVQNSPTPRPQNPRPGEGYRPGTSLGELPPPVFQTQLPGGQEWLYSCSDGQLGIRVQSSGQGCVVPQNFVRYESGK